MERRRGLLARPPEAEQGLLHILRPESAWAYTFGRRTPGNGRGALSFNCGRRIVRRVAGTQKGRAQGRRPRRALLLLGPVTPALRPLEPGLPDAGQGGAGLRIQHTL